MIAGGLFVTPHAVARFQRRIALLDYNQALAAIIRGLRHPVAMKRTVRHDGRPAYELAVVGEYCFIATVVPHESGQLLPAVVSIRYGTKGGGRKPEYERATWTRL